MFELDLSLEISATRTSANFDERFRFDIGGPMVRIAYLLHRFPAVTDTFIKREIRSLQKLGTDVRVVSIWNPDKSETTAAELSEWSAETDFILPRSIFSIGSVLFLSMVSAPKLFLKTLFFALSISRPGLRGHVYQLFYFIEAVLAADMLKKRKIVARS